MNIYSCFCEIEIDLKMMECQFGVESSKQVAAAPAQTQDGAERSLEREITQEIDPRIEEYKIEE